MQTAIQSLGESLFDSPLRHFGAVEVPFKTDADRILFNHTTAGTRGMEGPLSFEVAGPREKVFFDAPKATAAIDRPARLRPRRGKAAATTAMRINGAAAHRNT